MTKGYPNFEYILGIPITDKDDEAQNEDNKILHMKTRTTMKTLKMDKMKKAPKKRQMKMSTHQTGKMTQVTTSSKIKI